MVYQHEKFNLDTNSRRVFDENFKELSLTGNAYRLLVFMCEHQSATLTEIGDYLDRSKDYNENHLRQYRYKINGIIASEVIEYKNKIYSLVGELKSSNKKIELKERNTDLLHSDDVELNHNNISVDKNPLLKFSYKPAIIAIVFLLLIFYDWSFYAYYVFLRFVVTGVMAYYAYYIYKKLKKIDYWFWATVVMAIIFNPFTPVHFGDKGIWMFIDSFTVIFLIILVIYLDKKTKNI